MVFEGLKKKLHEKFLRETRKTEVDGKIIYWKRAGFLIKDWQRVYPPVTEDGKHWKPFSLFFGSTQNFVRTTLFVIIAILIFLAFHEYTSSLTAFLEQPEVRACLENIGYEIRG